MSVHHMIDGSLAIYVTNILKIAFLLGLLCDLLWSDPNKDKHGWSINDRGVSYTFGADVVTKFLEKHDFDLICRGHQVVEDGYEFFAKRQLITIFSAPNYCGEFDNAGALMSVNEDLLCSFQVCCLNCLLKVNLFLMFRFAITDIATKNKQNVDIIIVY